MRKHLPNIRKEKKFGDSEKKSGSYRRKQIHFTEIRGDYLITKVNNFEIEIWDYKKKEIMFEVCFVHPARSINYSPGLNVVLVYSLPGQASVFYLPNKGLTELNSFALPYKLHKNNITYIDEQNNCHNCNFQEGTKSKIHKKCIFLMIYKRKFKIK